MSTPHVIITGSIAIDRILSFSGRYRDLIHQDKLDVLSVSVLLQDMTVTEGGTGPNIAWSLAALGDSPVLLGASGHDSEPYMAKLHAAGVAVDAVHRSLLATASFTAFTDSDNNQVAGFYPGAMSDSSSLSLQPWFDQDVLVCIAAHDPAAMRRQVQECVQYNLPLLYDPGQQVSNLSADDLRAGVAAATIIAVNEYEHGLLADTLGMSADELNASAPLVIMTRGENGSVISGSALEAPLTITSAQPEQAVDPTGAGDAYRAGFLYGYLRKWDTLACAQLGTILASFVVEQAGTQITYDIDAIKQRYRATYNEELHL